MVFETIAMTGPVTRDLNRLLAIRDIIERELDDLLPDVGDPSHVLHAAMRYAVLSPGKRVRPVLALLCAEQLGCPLGVALPAACALELVHSASLVLDDLPCMDDANTRRGLPSVHIRYGAEVAVLTGVALLNEAYAIIGRATQLSESTRVAMISLLSRTVGLEGLIGGQDKDLLGVAEPTLHFFNQMHHEKTGVLFIASAEVGALAAGASPAILAALRSFAEELGLAFQALDDLDDEADPETSRTSVNLLSIMGRDALRDEAAQRMDLAKRALVNGGPELAPLAVYVDLLLGCRSAA